MPIISRQGVYTAIDGERDYQVGKHGNPGYRSIDEFALYILEYADQMKHICGTTTDPTAKLNAIRKVTALGVACMEHHGAPHR